MVKWSLSGRDQSVRRPCELQRGRKGSDRLRWFCAVRLIDKKLCRWHRIAHVMLLSRGGLPVDKLQARPITVLLLVYRHGRKFGHTLDVCGTGRPNGNTY